jgi:hypothetical protein
VKHFLQYVLSPQGQSDAARTDDFLPLPADVAPEQLARLE